MNQTEHYGLSQWALTDRVEMKDFNADNAKIDAALAALAAGGSGLENALAAAKQELTAAAAAETKRVNAELAKKALASDLATAKTGLETSLGGKLEQVTLLDTSFTASGSSCSVTVPGKEIAKCSLAMASIFSATLTPDSVFYTGSGTGGCHHQLGKSSSSPGILNFTRTKTHILVFFPMKGACPYVSGIFYVQDAFFFFYGPLAYSSFTSLTIKPPTGSTLSGNVTLKIHGLR